MRPIYAPLIVMLWAGGGPCSGASSTPIKPTKEPFYTKAVTLPPGKAHYKEIFAAARNNGFEVRVRPTSEGGSIDFRVMRISDYKEFLERSGAVPKLLIEFHESDILVPKSFVVPAGDYYFSIFNTGSEALSFVVEYRYVEVSEL